MFKSRNPDILNSFYHPYYFLVFVAQFSWVFILTRFAKRNHIIILSDNMSKYVLYIIKQFIFAQWKFLPFFKNLATSAFACLQNLMRVFSSLFYEQVELKQMEQFYKFIMNLKSPPYTGLFKTMLTFLGAIFLQVANFFCQTFIIL